MITFETETKKTLIDPPIQFIYQFCPVCENPGWDGYVTWVDTSKERVEVHREQPNYCPCCGKNLQVVLKYDK